MMDGVRPVGEARAPIEETQQLLPNDIETEVSGLEGLIENSPDSSAPGESLLSHDEGSGDGSINDVTANPPCTQRADSVDETEESNEKMALLPEPSGPKVKEEETNLDNPIMGGQDDHVGVEMPSCGNLMLVKPEIHEDFRDPTGSVAVAKDRMRKQASSEPLVDGEVDFSSVRLADKETDTFNCAAHSNISKEKKAGVETEDVEEEEEEEEQIGNTKPLLENTVYPLAEGNVALCDSNAMDTIPSPSSPSAEFDEVFVSDEHMERASGNVLDSGTMGNHVPKPSIPNRNQLKPLPIVKDHLTVKMNVGPKLSDASTDELSDVEEDLAYRDKPWYKQCRKSRACCISLYFWVMLLFLGSIAAMVTVGILVVDNYRTAERFKQALCNGYMSKNVGERIKCSCGKGCTSDYRCIDVSVQYTDLKGDSHLFGLRDNEAMIGRQCSYYPPCKSSRVANENAVRDYERKFGSPGQKYPCLYNPNDPSEVIRTRRFHIQHVVHGMVWSSLVFLISLGILIFAIKKKGCDFL